MNNKRLLNSIISVFLVLSLALVGFQSGAASAKNHNKKHSLSLKYPKNRAALNITNPRVLKWWKSYKKFSSAKYRTVKERAKPSPIMFSWEKKKGFSYKLILSTSPKFKNRIVFKSKKNRVKVYNLLRKQRYFWKVTARKGKLKIRSKVRTFKTLSIARVIRARGVSNIRDIGGYKTYCGIRTKQGLVYRSAHIDKLKKTGRKILFKKLKVKTELDLRRIDEGKEWKSSSYIKNYIRLRGSKYEDIFENGERRRRFIKGVKVFARRRNYPVLLHCTYGRDRTGTLVFVLNGLLGVSKKDLYRDYELSFLTKSGSRRVKSYLRSFDRLYKRMSSYEDDTKQLSYNIECYLLDSGVTKREIYNIKKILR